ncbi:hypothetical protein [Streptomyces sp. NPDC051546]|uniref:hypothetical protein n=1 Tax=Streptomyces sp. NPDC051546 TaxID=3365655 RepID=UPI0037AB8903
MEYSEGQAAGRLRVSRAALRWAVHTGAVPGPDLAAGTWSRAAVEAIDAAAVQAGLSAEPVPAYEVVQRLTDALACWEIEVNLSTAAELAGTGLLVDLSGDPKRPSFHPVQVEALVTRRDLARTVADLVLLGPDQAAARLRVRRVEFDHMVRLGWITATRTVRMRYPSSQGGPVTVALYRAADVGLLPAVYPEVSWSALRTAAKGSRSQLATLTAEDHQAVNLAGVGRIAGVGRAAAANWHRHAADFPTPTAGTDRSPLFARAEVALWLRANSKLCTPWPARRPAFVTVAGGQTVTLDDPDLLVRDGGREEFGGYTDRDAPVPWPRAELVRVEMPGHSPYSVAGASVDISYSGSPTRQYVTFFWHTEERRPLAGDSGNPGATGGARTP